MATIDTARSNKTEARTTVLSASAQKWHTHHTNHMNSGGFKLTTKYAGKCKRTEIFGK